MRRELGIIAVVVFAWVGLMAQNEAGVALKQSTRFAEFQSLMEPGYHYWDKGRFIAYDTDGTAHPPVVVYDSTGRVVLRAALGYPGVVETHVHDAAVDANGTLFVSASAISADGAAARYVGATNRDGDLSSIVRTNPFGATAICAAADGTVWAFGWEREAEVVRRDNSEYDTLRQYSFTRGLIRSFLPRSTMKVAGVSLLGRHLGDVRLRCGRDGVTLFYGPTSELVTINNNYQVTRKHVTPLGARTKVTGFAVTEDGQIFASLYASDGRAGYNGIYLLQPDANGELSWVGLKGTVGPGAAYAVDLLGADGTSLLLHREFPGIKLEWVPFSHQ